MKNTLRLLFFLFLLPGVASAQQPRLVVGIVVDQMRYDFLYRYKEHYTKGGFRRLTEKGHSCENTHYNYFPTYTGPGHAAVYTGTTPAVNGIVGNNWYIRESGKTVYVTEDKNVKTIGTATRAGMMSPASMLSSTITDQLKNASPGSKVIGIALKDRASILPAGHRADAAYWLDGSNGYWISSDYYIKSLPAWVEAFNARNMPREMIRTPWTTLLPASAYTASTADDVPFEKPFAEGEKCVFPYNLEKYAGKDLDIIRRCPYGNTLTELFAESAIKEEKLGKGQHTDFLTVSFSSTDYVGHQFGPHSIETEDTYLRLDRDLERFLNFLDKEVGEGRYLVFLTADHGVADVPAYALQNHVPAGEFKSNHAINGLKSALDMQFGKGDWVLYSINDQVYLNHNLAGSRKVSMETLTGYCSAFLDTMEGVAKVIRASELASNMYADGLYSNYQNGYHAGRCGDLFIVLKPGWFEEESGPYCTTHGSMYEYDTHVPLLFYGWKIKPGKNVNPANITDIAPTLASLLNILAPGGCTGKPIKGLLKN